MKYVFFGLMLMISVFQLSGANTITNFERKEFYSVLKSGTITEINSQIAIIQSSGITGKDAFEGTLLMKKAGVTGKPKDKLNLFKTGRIKLETAIKNDSTNVEYHFLRLIIQEHAPKQAKYQAQLKTDADFITENFKNASPELQEIIIDYSKQSKALITSGLR